MTAFSGSAARSAVVIGDLELVEATTPELKRAGLRTACVLGADVDRDLPTASVLAGCSVATTRRAHPSASYRLPIVVGDAQDRQLLRRLNVGRSRCVAAVTSDDLANIAIAMAARATRSDARVVLRAGDGEIARETRSLLHVGVVRDAHQLVAIGLAGAALRREPVPVVSDDGEQACIVALDGSARRWPPPADQ